MITRMKAITALLALLLGGCPVLAGLQEDADAADALKAAGDYAGAEAAYRQMFVDYPGAAAGAKVQIQEGLARAIRYQDRFVEAKDEYEKVITDYPGQTAYHPAARGFMGLCERWRGSREGARAEWDTLLADYPGAPHDWLCTIQMYIGETHMEQGHVSEAVAAFGAASTNYPNASEAMTSAAKEKLGEAYLRGGNKRAAGLAFIAAATDSDSASLVTHRKALKYMGMADLTPEERASYLAQVIMIVGVDTNNPESIEFHTQIRAMFEGLYGALP